MACRREGFSHLSSFPQFCAVLCSFTGISRRYVRWREKKNELFTSRNRRVHLIRLEHPGIITACLIRLFTRRVVMSSFYSRLLSSSSSFSALLLVPSIHPSLVRATRLFLPLMANRVCFWTRLNFAS